MSLTGDTSAPHLFVAVIGQTLTLRGELDLRGRETVSAAGEVVLARCRDADADGVLDGGGLTFVDAGGLAALIELAQALRARGSRLTTPIASSSLRRLCDICGVGNALGLSPGSSDTDPTRNRSVARLQAVPPP